MKVWKWLAIAYLPRFPLFLFQVYIFILDLSISILVSPFIIVYLILFILENCHLAICDFSASFENCLCSKPELHFQVKCYEESQCIKHNCGMEWSKKGALALSVCTSLTWDGPFLTSLEIWDSDHHSLKTPFFYLFIYFCGQT